MNPLIKLAGASSPLKTALRNMEETDNLNTGKMVMTEEQNSVFENAIKNLPSGGTIYANHLTFAKYIWKAALTYAAQSNVWEQAVVNACMQVESCLDKDPAKTLENLKTWWMQQGRDELKAELSQQRPIGWFKPVAQYYHDFGCTEYDVESVMVEDSPGEGWFPMYKEVNFPVVTKRNAREVMEKLLGEFIDLAAAFPEIHPNPKIWPHVSISMNKPVTTLRDTYE